MKTENTLNTLNLLSNSSAVFADFDLFALNSGIEDAHLKKYLTIQLFCPISYSEEVVRKGWCYGGK